MNNKKKFISITLIVIIILLPLILHFYKETNTIKKVHLTISAAASLSDAMIEITQMYNNENPNTIIEFNYGSSGSLQKQIEQGSPVDVFLSASNKYMDTLKNEDLLVDSSIKSLLKNDIVLIVPQNSELKLKSFQDLRKDDVKKIAIGELKSVPAGEYGSEVLEYYGLIDHLKTKTVYGKDVTEVLTWVEGGNADAGIVYKSDAVNSKKVTIVETAPAETHTPVEYPGAVIKTSENVEEAKDFLDFLSTIEAKKVLEKYGFQVE